MQHIRGAIPAWRRQDFTDTAWRLQDFTDTGPASDTREEPFPAWHLQDFTDTGPASDTREEPFPAWHLQDFTAAHGPLGDTRGGSSLTGITRTSS